MNCRKGDALRPNWNVCIEIMDKVLYGNQQLVVNRNPQMSIIEMDSNGRVLLPLGIRYKLDLNEGDKLAIDQLGDGTIILKKLAKKLSFMRLNE